MEAAVVPDTDADADAGAAGPGEADGPDTKEGGSIRAFLGRGRQADEATPPCCCCCFSRFVRREAGMNETSAASVLTIFGPATAEAVAGLGTAEGGGRWTRGRSWELSG